MGSISCPNSLGNNLDVTMPPGRANYAMKTTLISVLLLTGGLFAFAEPPKKPTPSDQIRDAEVIAFVSIPAVTTVTYTNSIGQVATNFLAEAKVERVLKGTPPESIRLKDGSTGSILSQHANLLTSRFLVFVRRSGDSYTTADKDDLAPVWGSVAGSRRVVWCSICISDGEAVAWVQKGLKK